MVFSFFFFSWGIWLKWKITEFLMLESSEKDMYILLADVFTCGVSCSFLTLVCKTSPFKRIMMKLEEKIFLCPCNRWNFQLLLMGFQLDWLYTTQLKQDDADIRRSTEYMFLSMILIYACLKRLVSKALHQFFMTFG